MQTYIKRTDDKLVNKFIYKKRKYEMKQKKVLTHIRNCYF